MAPYRLAPHLRVVAEEYIDKMLAAKIIRPSHSPYASPLMLVRKAVKLDPLNPLKGYRVVLDYRKVNANTVPDSYPMRNLNEMLDDIAQVKVWSVFDLVCLFIDGSKSTIQDKFSGRHRRGFSPTSQK